MTSQTKTKRPSRTKRPAFAIEKEMAKEGFFLLTDEVKRGCLSTDETKRAIKYDDVRTAAMRGEFGYRRAERRFFIASESPEFKAWVAQKVRQHTESASPVPITESVPAATTRLQQEVDSLGKIVANLEDEIVSIKCRLAGQARTTQRRTPTNGIKKPTNGAGAQN